VSVPIDKIKPMTDARDLDLPAGYTDLLGELKNRVRLPAPRQSGPLTPSSSHCTGPSARPFWNAKQLKDGGAGSSESCPKTWELNSRT
jgi:hypothetical protein